MRLILITLYCILGIGTILAQKRIPRKVINDTLHIVKFKAYSQNILYVAEGEPAPKFEVYCENGEKITLAELKGKTVILNFWITTCGPCRKELKRVKAEIIDRFKEKVVFLAVGAAETERSAIAFRESTGLDFPVYYDPESKTFEKFSNSGCPRNYIIDKDGIVRYIEMGYNDEKFADLIRKTSEVVAEN